MNKKNLIITISLILLILLGGFLLIKEKNNLEKDKLYSFEDYNLLKNNINLIANQDDIDTEILNKIEKGDYTSAEPLIMVNPYGISPLTAIVGFKTATKVSIQVKVLAKDGGKDLVYNTKEDTTHYIPIYGLYLDYNNQVTIELSDGTANTLSIPVEKSDDILMIYFPDVEVITNNLAADDNDFYFVSTPIGNTAAAFDQNGEIRWFLTNQIYKQLTKLQNGHFLLSSPEAIGDKAIGMLEVDLLGKVYNSYELSNPYYHNYTELKNGNILYATDDEKVIELNLSTGEIEKEYDIFKMLSEIDANHLNSIKDNFGYINSLDYDEKTDSVLVGIYYYSTLININKNGKIEWILANPEYYSEKFSKYLLTPTISNFIYPKGNFNAKLDNNTLTLINNGWDLTDTWSCQASKGLKSTASDYKIDASKKQITEKWRYGEDYFSFTFGDYYLNNNEKTILFGREFRSFVDSTDNCKLSDEGDFYSTIITLKDDEEVFKMTISNTYNYISKMPIYDQSYTFSKVTPKSYSANQISSKYTKEQYDEKFKKAILYTIPLELSANKLSIMYNKENYNLILLDEYGTGYIYEVENNQVNLKKGIGKSLVLIEDEGNIYNTGYYIDI
ncbi:MAG: aryl-sulfate sulfotransferase [Bacilli bacterium]|nr:aryl-sulfate sulfotransferase [Bacilli bacterium]